MFEIQSLKGMEILDSRGRPTVWAACELIGGARAAASVPSGASTGAAEALELRDGDKQRYSGYGCRKAAANVSGAIAEALVGKTFASQRQLDDAMLELDGTDNKSRLGANAVLAVSIAFARAVAMQRGVPLYQQFADILGQPLRTLPRLTINLYSGGKHAGKQVAIQDVLIVPTSAMTMDRSLVMMHDIYKAAAADALDRFGMRLLTADEGGLAPPFDTAGDMLDAAVRAMRAAGCEPGRDATIAMDVASSHFYRDGQYHIEPRTLDSDGMIDQLLQWIDRYPIVSVEDGLAEDDWEHWPTLCAKARDRVLVLGDDLLCTNPKRIERAIETNACNALLLKVNQIGTLSEAADAYRLARRAGWQITISVRSGETEDNWAADLAVGWGGDQFKNGSVTQSERLAKYNRLLAIEQEVDLPIVEWPRSSH
jgi:enolase